MSVRLWRVPRPWCQSISAQSDRRSRDLCPAQDRDHLLAEQLDRLDALFVDGAAQDCENMAGAGGAGTGR
jgi:hypothetical protein